MILIEKWQEEITTASIKEPARRKKREKKRKRERKREIDRLICKSDGGRRREKIYVPAANVYYAINIYPARLTYYLLAYMESVMKMKPTLRGSEEAYNEYEWDKLLRCVCVSVKQQPLFE